MIRILLAIYVACRHDAKLTIFLTISLGNVHNNASIIYNINSIVDNLINKLNVFTCSKLQSKITHARIAHIYDIMIT